MRMEEPLEEPENGMEPWLEAFIIRRQKWLVAEAQQLCFDAHQAQDLAQTTWIRFLQTFGGQKTNMPHENACLAWLVRTQSHIFFDLCRRKSVVARAAA